MSARQRQSASSVRLPLCCGSYVDNVVHAIELAIRVFVVLSALPSAALFSLGRAHRVATALPCDAFDIVSQQSQPRARLLPSPHGPRCNGAPEAAVGRVFNITNCEPIAFSAVVERICTTVRRLLHRLMHLRSSASVVIQTKAHAPRKSRKRPT